MSQNYDVIIVMPNNVIVENPELFKLQLAAKKRNDEKADELCHNIMCIIGWSIVCILLIWCILLVIMMIFKL
tara:strand:- start:1464 stop:1679 length:216 start_codon:yes stop_codon:yes gene_type:complete